MADEEVVKERGFIATSTKPSANLTLEWFAKSAFERRPNNFIEPLINGEVAFGAVARAIEDARKTVDIISWGFDASMRLRRPGGERIGELLKRKGRQGVKIRLLIWRNGLVQAMENTVPGINQYSGQGAKDLALSGANRAMPPANVPDPEVASRIKEQQQARIRLRQLQSERQARLMAQWQNPKGAEAARQIEAEFGPQIQVEHSRIEQLNREIDSLRRSNPGTHEGVGYGQGPSGKLVNSAGARGDPASARFNRDWHGEAQDGDLKNVEFRTRDFTDWDRAMIAKRQVFDSEDKSPWTQNALLASFPSHHQKMVLVDYEDPATAVGFVMGHNMHNNYWDTSDHLYNDEQAFRVPGFGPWQDLSTRVRGTVLFDLNATFCRAWDKGSPWYKRWFDSLGGDRDHLSPKSFVVKPGELRSVAQICRTQPDEGGEQSIREVYMRAAGNARRYVYVENQYFRYPLWAEHLKKTRKALMAAGRSETEHGTCHVFVITNSTEGDDMKAGRMRTAEMLSALGRQDRVPQVHRQQTKLKADAPVRPSDLAGLKVHVCTLVTDTRKPTQNASRPIYVHSKLLVVDDAFFTIGSANINARSMESDSELNIASDDSAIARQWRERLFALHTGRAPNDDAANEFKEWRDLMNDNGTAIKRNEPLQGRIVEFFDGGSVTRALD